MTKKSKLIRYSVGIDEVGRGSLAGPLFVAAVAIPVNFKIRNKELGAISDSKKTTALKREKWFDYFRAQEEIKYAISRVYPRVIEIKNVSKAANLAAIRAFNLLIKTHDLKPGICRIYLDGGLHLGNGRARSLLDKGVSYKTIIRGDEKYTAIKIASIIAKVSRDKLMVKLAKQYPGYHFELHKGYGTKTHFAAIKKLGPLQIHRSTFIKSLQSSLF